MQLACAVRSVCFSRHICPPAKKLKVFGRGFGGGPFFRKVSPKGNEQCHGICTKRAQGEKVTNVISGCDAVHFTNDFGGDIIKSR